ncbi:MAG: hypothetical protein ACREMA_16070, partial [Longimicrobiales bacterium]
MRTIFPVRRIPADRQSTIAQKYLSAVYPLPNVSNQRQNNFVNTVNKGIYNYNAEVVRVDHIFSNSNKVFGSWYYNHRDEFRSNNGLQGTVANQGQWPQTRNNYGGRFDWVTTLSPTSVLDLGVGFTRFIEIAGQTDVQQFDARSLGFRQLPGPFMPRIDLDQYTGVGVGSQGINPADNTASAQGFYTKTFSRHTLKYGGDYRNIRTNRVTTGTESGFFNFTRQYTRNNHNTADATSGHSVASFLLGYPANGEIGSGEHRATQWHYTALFVQDDVRLTRRLTVNLGLRWDYESPVTERYDRLVRGFAFDQASPLADRVRNAPGAANCPACANLRGGLLFAGIGGQERGLFDPDRNNFQPRVGLAYQLGGKTVLRGGYGMFWAPWNYQFPSTVNYGNIGYSQTTFLQQSSET